MNEGQKSLVLKDTAKSILAYREKTTMKRRTPINTPLKSTVIYPSTLFSLEKDEIYPYERYAYKVLTTGVEALNIRGLPERITVDFTQLPTNGFPWTINASIEAKLGSDGSPVEFIFATPELAPAIFYLISAVVGSEFCSDEGFERIQKNPDAISDRLHLFVEAAGIGVAAYKDKGLGFAIRAAYDHLGLSVSEVDETAEFYDLLIQQVAYHEVAHAYIQQFTRLPCPSPAERVAFELIADLVATECFYNKIVKNTPDSEAYRAFRKMGTYRETILSNSLVALRSQQLLLIVFAIAGAQTHSGRVTLKGGAYHPPGLQRHILQHMHLYTLVRSNFSPLLSESDFDQIDRDWDVRRNALIRSGLIPLSDLEASFNISECDTIELAAKLIEELQIPELKKVIPALTSLRSLMSEAISGRKRK